MNECAMCTDYLNIVDFIDDLVCPICYRRAIQKRDAAIDYLEIILKNSKDEAEKAKIKNILNMVDF